MARSKSSSAWLREHVEDPFVQRAQKDGYRARAAYKLIEIDDRDRLIRPGMLILDLGSAPGSWSQVASQRLAGRGEVIATDILPMDPFAGVHFCQGDFREPEIVLALQSVIAGRAVDLVISDMAPNISGSHAVDQPRSIALCELALDMARRVLKPQGCFLVKVFQGEGSDDFRRALLRCFAQVKIRKPKASRPRSREVYMLGCGYQPAAWPLEDDTGAADSGG